MDITTVTIYYYIIARKLGGYHSIIAENMVVKKFGSLAFKMLCSNISEI